MRAAQHPPGPEPIDRLAPGCAGCAPSWRTETAPTSGQGIRLRAVRGAYLDLLRAACERLDVTPPPPRGPPPQAEIYRVEAALRERGLDVGRRP